MKKALVCGAGGFIGGHLVKKLKREGYWVRGVDIKEHEFAATEANEFLLLDLREDGNCRTALTLNGESFDEVYQLAADMGGMGFISSAECDIMRNSALINSHMIKNAVDLDVKRYFFSSSACVYRDMQPGEPPLTEDDAYPAMPDNEYGWEKLYAERMAFAYMRSFDIEVRVARFQNCYGPDGTWDGGREKAPAAICRKVAQADDGGIIDVWGDGSAIRAYTYVDDLVDGIFTLMHSEFREPITIGSSEFISVSDLARTAIDISGKNLNIRYVEGPVGVQARILDKTRIQSTGWEAKIPFKEGLAITYKWIEEQVNQG